MGTSVQPTTIKSSSLLDKFCLAIRDYEGAPGDANYRNNNPGNCRYYEGGYLPVYEPVLRSPAGFAVFKNMATGTLYLENLVKEKIHNHPRWTLSDFFENYAPSSDNNNPLLYASFVARRLGVSVSYQCSQILN